MSACATAETVQQNRILSIIRMSKLNRTFHAMSYNQRKLAVNLIANGTDPEQAIKRAKELCR